MKLQDVLTTEPFKTENGALVKASGIGKMPKTEKWDKTKKCFVYHWFVPIVHIATGRYQYWVFDYYGNRIKVLKSKI